ncbi:MAG: tRNA 2-thiouridine(34) synthase MnmA [Defluviitaleaceae bacterium]|nr:tRNA 2-thiouridine(34) synthase MnmA [Defluviitaleaceae bacterium]MCL2240005.1 tRNA 2-thiouridine(34) synthase MnmA [Defluviitaleaceae bacterium]
MSGGVDSSVAAVLLQQNGYECTGAMMKLFDAEGGGGAPPPRAHRGCCTLEDAEDARAVAQRLGLPFYVFNFTQAFQERVVARFALSYRRGITPNPCIDCNRFVKFEKFLHRAAELGQDFIATGHYARITHENGRWLLKKGLDETKDQSYVLYAMTQQQLARTLFPLGTLTKEAARELAAQAGLGNAKKRDSQDICFAPDGDYTRVIGNAAPGDFIDAEGRVLGRHRGLIHYTIGQRKGLQISAPHPLYVRALDGESNTVVLGTNEQLFSRALTANEINLIPFDALPAPLRVTAKIRYSHTPQCATVRQVGDDTLHIEFDQPQRAITPGQAVVLYDGDMVVGGGTIISPLP